MVDVQLIKTEAEYEAALARAEKLMSAEEGTAAAEELEHLAMVIEAYEERHHPIDLPDPISAIQFRMEQEGLLKKDLIPYIGSSAKVSEVLSGKRDLTLSMIRALNKHLGIPAEVLIQEPGGVIPDDDEGVDWTRFPIAEMVKRKLVKAKGNVKDNVEMLMRELIRRAGGFDAIPVPLFRKNDSARCNAKMDSYALMAWCTYVLSEAYVAKPKTKYKEGTINPAFLREVAKLSASENGPALAQSFLADHGIVLIIAPHLRNTYLDGAAMRLRDGTPVVGMTLRYDRLDNFWFCLLHELAHIARHTDCGGKNLFVDDLDLRATDDDVREREADEWAENALIPAKDWDEHPAQEVPTVGNAIALAQRVKVHPAIVAGRIRRKFADYRKLTQLVGNGDVRKHFPCDWN
ncbi:MAG: ImmA/IrrE family metallo-endopeptidase [Pseudomonadota bacterium]